MLVLWREQVGQGKDIKPNWKKIIELGLLLYLFQRIRIDTHWIFPIYECSQGQREIFDKHGVEKVKG